MSKISLEPNVSGAGTFTLAAPNSNTNRTLTLPDEAGKLLSTGNDDPAEIFKHSNILGTVSESGGVPTGAIIERGVNSSGEYVRYADGTQICWRVRLDSGRAVTTSRGDGFVSGALSAPFPIAFVGDVAVLQWTSTSQRGVWLTHAEQDSDNTWRWRWTSFTSIASGNFISNHVAVGRWY